MARPQGDEFIVFNPDWANKKYRTNIGRMARPQGGEFIAFNPDWANKDIAQILGKWPTGRPFFETDS